VRIDWPPKASDVGFSVMAGVMVKLRETCGAALYDALPAWSAAMVHVPIARIVIVAPFVPVAVQFDAVSELNVTGLPDPPPVAVAVKGGSPSCAPAAPRK
jgi:hypothetical protein